MSEPTEEQRRWAITQAIASGASGADIATTAMVILSVLFGNARKARKAHTSTNRTPARDELCRLHYPKGMPLQELLVLVNALPGPPMTKKGLESRATSGLKLRRKEPPDRTKRMLEARWRNKLTAIQN